MCVWKGLVVQVSVDFAADCSHMDLDLAAVVEQIGSVLDMDPDLAAEVVQIGSVLDMDLDLGSGCTNWFGVRYGS